MTNLASNFTAFGRIPAGWRGAGFALVAGIFMSAAGTLPAAAASPADWQKACNFPAAPQGYGDSIRYNNCVRQRDCERLANAEGATVFALGCFGVAPDAPVPSSSTRSYR